MTRGPERPQRQRWLVPALCAGFAVLLAAPALIGLRADAASAEHVIVDGVPITVMKPGVQGARPVVVIAHGFAGSAVIMGALAEQVTKAGAIAVTFDFVGHGANPTAMPAGGGMSEAGQSALQADLDTALRWIAGQPDADIDQLALVGHSMGAGAVVRYAVEHPTTVRSVAAISLPSAAEIPQGAPAVPPNLLLLVGSAEPQSFRDAALTGLRNGYPAGQLGQIYGNATDGTLRSAQLIAGSEHVGIVFAPATASAVTQWLADTLVNEAGQPTLQASSDAMNTLLWLAMLLAAGVFVMVPITRLLYPRPVESHRQPWRSTAQVIAVVALAVIVADLVAALLQGITDHLPLAVGGYLASWFTTAGVVMIAVNRWAASALLRKQGPSRITLSIGRGDLIRALVSTTLVVLLIAVPSRLTWAPFALVGARWWLALVILVAFTLFFWGEERLLRDSTTGRRWSIVLCDRVLVIAGLLAAIPLLGAPGFLILLLPLMVLLLFLLAGFAGIVARRDGGFLGAVLVQSVPLALLAATTFPLLTGY
ncbi:MAG: alpha/beta hydrolase [Actinomycetales bacterium]